MPAPHPSLSSALDAYRRAPTERARAAVADAYDAAFGITPELPTTPALRAPFETPAETIARYVREDEHSRQIALAQRAPQ